METGRWENLGEPGGNPHEQGESMQRNITQTENQKALELWGGNICLYIIHKTEVRLIQ